MILKFTAILLAVLSVVHSTNAAAVKSAKQNTKAKEPWELIEAIGATDNVRGFNATWITDEELYFTAKDRSIHKYNAATDTDSIFVPAVILATYGFHSSFTVSPDNKKILIRYAAESVFRHSSIAKFDIFDLETLDVVKINNGKRLQYCAWSPINGRVAYVYDNNVYVHFEDHSEIQLTTDGVTGVIYNGVPDWVYEEEVLSANNAIWWSPDGSKLAVGNFNDTNVRTYKYAVYGNPNDITSQYPKDEYLKYPKPGTPNPIVELRVFDLPNKNGKNLRSITLKAPINIVTNDHIMQDVAWTDNNNLLVLWMNRRQNLITFQLCIPTGQCREVKRFEEPNGWIKINTPICQSSGDTCVFSYWIGDWFQVWKMDLKTGGNLWKSRGDFTVQHVYGYDELNDNLYYQATLQGEPYAYHIFRNDYCLTCNLRSLEHEKCDFAAAAFSKNFSYYGVACTGPGPRYSRIFETKSNKLVKDWEANLEFRKMLSSKPVPTERFMNVTLPDGSNAVVRLELPPNMNPKKKYPMIVQVYGGPDSVRAWKIFSIGFHTYLTTTRNVIYAYIDGRGTGNKGKKYLFTVNNNLGHYEAEDQIFVTKYLQKHLSYVDRERTGIWGWSYGGYVAAKTLEVDTDRVFQCGISVAPVVSWLYYDSIYTERYMGLPTPNDNLKNYDLSSLVKNVDNFRTHDFLLIHGTADDNVHYQQSLALAKTLESNDILFEQISYVDENHSINNFSPHLYHTMEHFWSNYLGLDMDEEE